MTRLLRWLLVAPLAIAAFLVAGSGIALADNPGSPSPAAVASTSATGAYDLGTEPAIPYVAALLVTSAGLTLVGFAALRLQRRPYAAAGQPGWWSCEACAASNPAERQTCFACRTPRGSPPADADLDAGVLPVAPDEAPAEQRATPRADRRAADASTMQDGYSA